MARFATLYKPHHIVKRFLWYFKSLVISLECILAKASLTYMNEHVFLQENLNDS